MTTGEIYVRDLVAGNTIWVSTNARAIYQSVTGGSTISCCNYSISDDGQFVAFEACTNYFNSSAPGIILRYSLQTGLNDIINTNAYVPQLSYELIHDLSMSPDGRFVAYVTNGPTANAIYLWDAQTGTNTLVSVSLDNVNPANGVCDSPVVSSNGQYVAFISTATNLVTNTLAGDCHVYVRNLQAGVTQLLDADANGVGVGVDSTTVPAMSANGSVVAFDSANLLTDNRHQVHDVFVRNVTRARPFWFPPAIRPCPRKRRMASAASRPSPSVPMASSSRFTATRTIWWPMTQTVSAMCLCATWSAARTFW